VVNGGFEFTFTRSTMLAPANEEVYEYPGDPGDFFFGWSKTGAMAAAVVDGKWGSKKAVTGNYGLQLGSSKKDDGVIQTITGLTPNTKYQVMGSLKVETKGDRILFGIKNFGGTEITQTITDTEFNQVLFSFTTGSNATTADIYVNKPKGKGFGYADCLFVVQNF
jgi:hypothetical protein